MRKETDRRKLLAAESGLRPRKSGKVTMALCYPNDYGTGMSNLGFLTIYRLANQLPRMKCERAFHGIEDGRTLETGKRISRFDLVGISANYELDYPRAVSMIGDSGIPLLREERTDSDPVVMAGGPAASMNPKPLSPFVDIFFLGEAEDSFREFAELLDDLGYTRKSGWRRELLKRVSGVAGTYVPGVTQRAKRRWVARLENCHTYSPILTPHSHFSGMYLVETERGCPRGCRFCAATYLYRPFRLKSAASIVEQTAKQGLAFSRIGLIGAGLSDHPDIERLCMAFTKQGKEVGVSSLRPENLTPNLVSTLAEGGLRTLTIAPEAGSQRMRDVIGKPIPSDSIVQSVRLCNQSGLPRLRLYFMLGLPFETAPDVDAISDLVGFLSHHFRRNISVRLSPFVPKANTPFQWEPLTDPDTLSKRVSSVEKGLSSRKNVKVASRSSREARMEAIFSRGDEDVGFALLHWYRCRSWKRAFKTAGVRAEDLVFSEFSHKEPLPWDFIDTSFSKSHLKAELRKARRAAS